MENKDNFKWKWVLFIDKNSVNLYKVPFLSSFYNFLKILYFILLMVPYIIFNIAFLPSLF
jgi:hypothetical protein